MVLVLAIRERFVGGWGGLDLAARRQERPTRSERGCSRWNFYFISYLKKKRIRAFFKKKLCFFVVVLSIEWRAGGPYLISRIFLLVRASIKNSRRESI